MMKTSILTTLSLVLTVVLTNCAPKENQTEISLAGRWTVRLDSLNRGAAENWAAAELSGQSVELPGTLDEAGIGTPDTVRMGMNNYVLASLRRKKQYIGKAWYQREVQIPQAWAGKQVRLSLERAMWVSQVYVDGQSIGTNNSLVGHHEYDLTEYLTPGEHRLTVMVDNENQYPFLNVLGDKYPDEAYQEMAHGYTNHTQIKWNGLLGDLELIASDAGRLTDLRISTDVNRNAITVKFKGGAASSADNYRCIISDVDGNALFDQAVTTASDAEGSLTFTIDRPKEVELWDEFNPNTYQLTLRNGTASVTSSFGFRTVGAKDGLLTLNGDRIFLRGNLECSIFPLTGRPPMEKGGWEHLISQAKAYGLNHLRFHSWCPPAAAFEAADEAGIYLQAELPHWSLKVGEDAATTTFLRHEAQRMLEQYGNHPSFILMSMGNELQGDLSVLNDMTAELKAQDDRRLFATTTFSFQQPSGTRPEPEDEFFVTQWTDAGWVRGQGVFNDYAPNFDKDYRANSSDVKIPLISHEIGQYSVYPSMAEIEKYTGVLRPTNFESIREELRRKGMLEMADAFTQASGKLAAMLYKEEIERAMKTPNFSGFQLLQLQDFPGQGTALVGLLDAFWDSKGAISAEEFRKFNSEVVPLLRFEKAVYEGGETFAGDIMLANFLKDMDGQTLSWEVLDENGSTVAKGATEKMDLPLGVTENIGTIRFEVADDEARSLRIELRLDGTEYRNDWPLWTYPSTPASSPEGVVITRSHAEAERALRAGKTVLLNPKPEDVPGVKGRFVPVFWSPVHFPDQPATMGLLIDPDHPALSDFPTSTHTQWQWWDLCIQSTSINVDSLAVTPIVRVVDNFVTNRKLTNLFEAKVGEGKLLFSSMDLIADLGSRPAARQLRASVLAYMQGQKFAPSQEMSFEELRGLQTTR